MKSKSLYREGKREVRSSRIQESAVMLPGVGRTFNVRVAKAQLSGLLDLVASGEEVVLTADGKPKARLIPYKPKSKPFKVDWEHLRSMPMNTGPSATEIVRADRDARGW
ncbi:MAG: type II toxin-antitoxin system prevent-host-death family antitoxin [Candidatus Methylacidiphilales bacterium]|nr:type II toxin-antitoxin system prevent-host-death family antitoxin [Candidatus Methylacidiphilales bacterium]